MIPTIAAASNIQKFPLSANTTPLTLINAAPSTRIVRLPSPSATSVSRKLMKTSPTSVSVMNRPILALGFPSAERYDARISVDPPYANNRTNRCRIRIWVSAEALKSVTRPISLIKAFSGRVRLDIVVLDRRSSPESAIFGGGWTLGINKWESLDGQEDTV